MTLYSAETAFRPRQAMLLAAGLGIRMRPITDRMPKPLIQIGGRSLLERILDKLAAAGVSDVVVNAHYLPEQIVGHLADRSAPRVRISRESERLETGGGVVKALPMLGTEPFFVINGDVLWRDGAVPTLEALAAAWDAARMDALLLVQSTATAIGYDGPGDFDVCDDGRLCRRAERPSAPFLFAGVQILHPRLCADAPAPPFSLNVLYDRAIAAGRAFAHVHDGGWCHVGTPADIAAAEAFVAAEAR